MDAIVKLRADHKAVEKLFKRFEKDDLGVVPEICAALSLHAAIEEQVFYPAVRSEVDGELDDVLEAVEEHRLVKGLVSELDGMSGDEETYRAKATVLMELVRHHVEEEETEMFPRVRAVLGRRRLQEIGADLAAAAGA